MGELAGVSKVSLGAPLEDYGKQQQQYRIVCQLNLASIYPVLYQLDLLYKY